jgi:hypothetical protein
MSLPGKFRGFVGHRQTLGEHKETHVKGLYKPHHEMLQRCTKLEAWINQLLDRLRWWMSILIGRNSPKTFVGARICMLGAFSTYAPWLA